MASKTTNLNLTKPDSLEKFNLADWNSNMDKIDEAVGDSSEVTTAISEETEKITSEIDNAVELINSDKTKTLNTLIYEETDIVKNEIQSKIATVNSDPSKPLNTLIGEQTQSVINNIASKTATVNSNTTKPLNTLITEQIQTVITNITTKIATVNNNSAKPLNTLIAEESQKIINSIVTNVSNPPSTVYVPSTTVLSSPNFYKSNPSGMGIGFMRLSDLWYPKFNGVVTLSINFSSSVSSNNGNLYIFGGDTGNSSSGSLLLMDKNKVNCKYIVPTLEYATMGTTVECLSIDSSTLITYFIDIEDGYLTSSVNIRVKKDIPIFLGCVYTGNNVPNYIITSYQIKGSIKTV